MGIIIWLLLASGGLVVASELIKRKRSKYLPDISDEDFLREYKERFTGTDLIIKEERRQIGEHVRIPYRKLSSNHRFDELSLYAGIVGEFEVGISDLGDELTELCERLGISCPHPFPATVGEFINEMVKVKEKLASSKM